jgi:uncharacterized protein DUF2783
MKLVTTTNLSEHDPIFERLSALYDGLDGANSSRASARLLLLLINHIGDEQVINEAIEIASAVAHEHLFGRGGPKDR